MIFLGWIFILWAAYLLLNHRHNIKDSKKLIVGIVSLVFLGVVMFAVGNSNSHSSTKQQTSSKVVRKHHSERKQKRRLAIPPANLKHQANHQAATILTTVQ